MTFEEFMEQFTSHIDGTATNEREAHDSEDEVPVVDEAAKKSSRKPGTGASKSKHDQMNRTSSHFNGEASSVENDRKTVSRSKKSNMETSKHQSMSVLNKTNGSFKFELPQTCMVSMMKKVLIEKMEGKYFLASHPYPKLEGEMIIFKPKKGDQNNGKDVIVYRDFSLRKRVETSVKSATEE